MVIVTGMPIVMIALFTHTPSVWRYNLHLAFTFPIVSILRHLTSHSVLQHCLMPAYVLLFLCHVVQPSSASIDCDFKRVYVGADITLAYRLRHLLKAMPSDNAGTSARRSASDAPQQDTREAEKLVCL